ncbi:MAG: 30S ribosomal protein S8 [Acidimicrobiales bacterium]|jgi:small subunit ribosomal protein S8
MTMTDPIADMLTRIRNANSAMFETVRMPGSKLKVSLAGILEREGFIAGYHVEPNRESPGTTLEITMKYSGDRTRTIAGIKRISKPGLRIYARADGIPRVLGGMGVAVLSTSQGLVTDREARKKHLGGEVLCHVW